MEGQTIVSTASPAAQLSFRKEFTYIAGQVVHLYGNAEAERYLFAVPGSDGIARRFYWIQFEHFLPTNARTYEYPSQNPVNIDGLPFSYDVKSFSDYAAMQESEPGSDGAAMIALLAAHHLRFPAKAARVRLIHLPTADHRTELMMIYGEAISSDVIPVNAEGIRLDDVVPDAAKLMLAHAKEGLAIRSP